MTKVGFIGAGDISLLHAEGVQEAEGAELAGLWNRTRSRAEEKAAFFGCKVFDTPEELVDAVDVVYVLTNMEPHHEYSMLAIELRAGALPLGPSPRTRTCVAR